DLPARRRRHEGRRAQQRHDRGPLLRPVGARGQHLPQRPGRPRAQRRRRRLARAQRRAPVRVRRRRAAGVDRPGGPGGAPRRHVAPARRAPGHLRGALGGRGPRGRGAVGVAAGRRRPLRQRRRRLPPALHVGARAGRGHRLPPPQPPGRERVRGALLGSLVLPGERAGAVPGGDALRLRFAAQRRPRAPALHRRGVRARLLAAAEPGGQAGGGLRLRLPDRLRGAAAADAGGVLVPVPPAQRLRRRRAPARFESRAGAADNWRPSRPPAAAMPILRMTDLDLAGRRVLVRQDLNVPVADGRVTSDQRILASLPTLRALLDAGAAVMVMSHLGRPREGTWSEADSLAPVAARLSGLLGRGWPLVRDYLDGVEVAPGQLVLLETCRMNPGEKADDEALARRYAALCDVFVMDAFGTAHRAQASTHGVIRHAAQACGGPLLMAELDALGRALQDPARPLLAIVAGSKVSTKLELLSSLVAKVDQLIVGGGIANTFIAAAGHGVGKSLYEADLVDTARRIMDD